MGGQAVRHDVNGRLVLVHADKFPAKLGGHGTEGSGAGEEVQAPVARPAEAATTRRIRPSGFCVG